THSIVTGNVAALLDVENAKVCAGAKPLKKPLYEIFLTNVLRTNGYAAKIISNNPAKTVKEYQLKLLKISITFPISSPAILLTTPANKANTKNGAACMTTSTIFKKTSLIPSTKFSTGCDLSTGIKSKQTPKKMAKKII